MKLNTFQLLNFGERLNLALSALSNLPDDLDIDDDVALAVQHAIAPLESYASRTPAEHAERLSKSIAQDAAQLAEHRKSIDNAERTLTRTCQPGERDTYERIRQDRDHAVRQIPKLEESIRVKADTLQKLEALNTAVGKEPISEKQ